MNRPTQHEFHHIWGTPEPSDSSETRSASSGRKEQSRHEVHRILEEVDLHSISNSTDSRSDEHNGQAEELTKEGSASDDKKAKLFAFLPDTATDDKWHSLHFKGECKPCRFITSKSGCTNGSACLCCHFAHQRPARPWKAKREQVKAVAAQRLQDSVTKGPEEVEKVAQALSKKSSYMKSVVQGKLRDSTMAQSSNSTPDRSAPSKKSTSLSL
mmetsp:Transcript_100045/g.158340  ORF Transcript_100045/g.158340 Transcript_100045/m.158340 type:complete len:213 (+) Transcript_100045:87-725(+)|eukprot:CAMPEP_0169070286 /NCGR_PEP_ID=MMETSP1015-20121227/5033_1 /TAXON_ID=342587 /ORGANISM="Karlodinium micrum, Strain CCMP2283" /LENGTH=212 /DNA_ID=CAMNT_0009129271 /DNA_START=80 /DNA_END=718 /DNA_ORIENTATION=+